MSDLVRNLREEAERLSGLSLDRGVQEAGISANLADRAADVIEEYQAKEVLADRAHKVMTAEIEKFQRNLRHRREECGKLHAKLAKAEEDLRVWEITAKRVAEEEGIRCAALKAGSAGGNDPQDCDWPVCGCDPAADKVIAALEEGGHLVARKKAEPIAYITSAGLAEWCRGTEPESHVLLRKGGDLRVALYAMEALSTLPELDAEMGEG